MQQQRFSRRVDDLDILKRGQKALGRSHARLFAIVAGWLTIVFEPSGLRQRVDGRHHELVAVGLAVAISNVVIELIAARVADPAPVVFPPIHKGRRYDLRLRELCDPLARLGQFERRECLEILGLPAEVERAVAVVFRDGSADLSTYRSTMMGKPQKAAVAPTAAPRYLAHVCSSKLPGTSRCRAFFELPCLC